MAKRIPIPDSTRKAVAAKNADVCCVCKTRGVGTEIHHIDQNPGNNAPSNLAVLCVADHDAHHRPGRYACPSKSGLSADRIRIYKDEWERFVAAARGSSPAALAVLNVYGDVNSIHSVRLLFQWADGGIVLERIYHLHHGTIEQWVEWVLEEVQWLGPKLQLTVVDEVLNVTRCPGCGGSLANTIDANLATKLTASDWASASACAVYINPHQASLAVTIWYGGTEMVSAAVHKCGGTHLHLSTDKFEERLPIHQRPSVRTQARDMVTRFLDVWQPGQVLYATGSHDAPVLIHPMDLPPAWEQ